VLQVLARLLNVKRAPRARMMRIVCTCCQQLQLAAHRVRSRNREWWSSVPARCARWHQWRTHYWTNPSRVRRFRTLT